MTSPATPSPPNPPSPSDPQSSKDFLPDLAAVRHYFFYTLSLPERALRSGTGLAGGMIRESASLLLPQSFQDSRTYNVMVRQTLDFLIEDIGGVASQNKNNPTAKIDNFVARKAIGNFIEMAGLATLHVSPVMLLAIVSDVAYGSKQFVQELGSELKRAGVIDQNSTIDHVDDILASVAEASNVTANAFFLPPLSLEGLKQTIVQTKQALSEIDPASVIPQAELQRLWEEMHELAGREEINLLSLSGAVTLQTLDKIATFSKGALSSVKVAGRLFDRHVLDHYQQSIQNIRQKGLYASLSETVEPYVDALWENFSFRNRSFTEKLFSGRIFRNLWKKFSRHKEMTSPDSQQAASPSQ